MSDITIDDAAVRKQLGQLIAALVNPEPALWLIGDGLVRTTQECFDRPCPANPSPAPLDTGWSGAKPQGSEGWQTQVFLQRIENFWRRSLEAGTQPDE